MSAPDCPDISAVEQHDRDMRDLAKSLGVDPNAPEVVEPGDIPDNQVFVPLPANNVFPNCLNGCVAVFGSSGDDD